MNSCRMHLRVTNVPPISDKFSYFVKTMILLMLKTTTEQEIMIFDLVLSPAYGFFILQLIQYARACSSYECFILKAVRLSS